MRSYLFAISLGPVQGFIGAARRTRDFWMGSTLLSECAKAAARWIVDQPGSSIQKLIFPAPASRDDLKAWDFDENAVAPTSDFNVTNVLLFHLPSDAPSNTINTIREQVIEQWKSFVQRTLNYQDARDEDWPVGMVVRDDLNADVLRLQESFPEDVFEFFAAWAPFDSAADDYSKCRALVMRLLNGRKSLRDFAAITGVQGIPKCSLDGLRESVLKKPAERKLPLRIRSGEQLDLIGLVKRLQFGNNAIRFPSVSRFAVDPWIRGVLSGLPGRESGPQLLAHVDSHCRSLVKLRVLRLRKRMIEGKKEDDWPKFPWWNQFPFEGTPLLATRHHELLDEVAENVNRVAVEVILQNIAKRLSYNRDDLDLPKPEPYFAIIAADGDRMGQMISELCTRKNAAALHRAFSAAQSKFDDDVRQRLDGRRDLMGRDRGESGFCAGQVLHGATVFAGADDILGFVPLDQCLAAAWMMQDLFRQTLHDALENVDSDLVKQLDAANQFPTLSAGIAIGHFLDPLEDLLRFAKQSEHRAKNPTPDDRRQESRNGLAISVHSRGGAPFTIRLNWTDASMQHLNAAIDLSLNRDLSTRAAYDLRELAVRYDSRDAVWGNHAQLAAALSGEAMLILGRKRSIAGTSRDTVRTLLRGVETSADVHAVASQLLVGQWIADAQVQSGFRWSFPVAQDVSEARKQEADAQ